MAQPFEENAEYFQQLVDDADAAQAQNVPQPLEEFVEDEYLQQVGVDAAQAHNNSVNNNIPVIGVMDPDWYQNFESFTYPQSKLFHAWLAEPAAPATMNALHNPEVGNSMGFGSLNADTIHAILGYLSLYEQTHLARASDNWSQTNFRSFALDAFKRKYKSVLVLNRYHLQSGEYIPILQLVGGAVKGLRINTYEPYEPDNVPSIQAALLEECYVQLRRHVDWFGMKSVAFVNAENFFLNKLQLAGGSYENMTKLHLRSDPISISKTKLNLGLFPKLEDLFLHGDFEIICQIALPRLKQVIMLPYADKFLDSHALLAYRPLTYLEIGHQSIPLNRIIECLHALSVHTTLKTFRFYGHLTHINPTFALVPVSIVDEIKDFKKLEEVDFRMWSIERPNMPPNKLCTHANVKKLIHLESVERLILTEPFENDSEGRVYYLFKYLRYLKHLVAILIVDEDERRMIQEIRPTYRIIDQYTSTTLR